MKFNKTLLAAALMVAAGSANAALVTNSATGGDSAFLVAYDSAYVYADGSVGRTFNLDLGVTFNQLFGNINTALAAYTGAGKSLLSDSNWTAFATGMTSSVKFAVVSEFANDASIYATGNTAPVANIDPTVMFNTTGDAIRNHANQINAGMAVGANSSLIKQTAAGLVGQANSANNLWTGWPHDPQAAFGTSTNFYLGGHHTGVFDDGFDLVTRELLAQSDIVKVGTFNLSGNTLTFVSDSAPVSAVPVPAAVWMFGAGLMGVLRLNRRKAVQA